MKTIILVFGALCGLIARADAPRFAEQSALFADHSETTFDVPQKPAVPHLGQVYWSEVKRWQRVSVTVIGQKPVAGLRKTLALYRATDGGGSVLETTFHPHGPMNGHWWTEGSAASDQFVFYSHYRFHGDETTSFYKEDCRPWSEYLVCRVTNQDETGRPGFVAYLNYVSW